jgi:hypothetical protein
VHVADARGDWHWRFNIAAECFIPIFHLIGYVVMAMVTHDLVLAKVNKLGNARCERGIACVHHCRLC